MGAFESAISHRARTMKSLLVCLAFAAIAFADDEPAAVPLVHPFYHGLGLGYAHHPIVQHQPIQYKYVPEEVPIEIKSVKFVAPESTCVNVFGHPVPCLAEGEARRKRDAEETEAVAAPALLPYHFGGYPYHYGYHGYPVVKPLEPKIVEIPVKTPVYKHVVEEVPLGPACQNHLGLAVPCA